MQNTNSEYGSPYLVFFKGVILVTLHITILFVVIIMTTFHFPCGNVFYVE